VTSDSIVEFVVGDFAENVEHAVRKTDAMRSPRK
jgi:hypothetical protein